MEEDRRKELINGAFQQAMSIQESYSNELRSFNNFEQLYDFIKEQKVYWEKYQQSKLGNVYGYYARTIELIETIKNNDNEQIVINRFTKLRNILNQSTSILFSNTPVARYLTNLCENDISRADIAYDILVNKNRIDFNQINDTAKFQGLVDAIRFLYPVNIENDKSEIEQLAKVKAEYHSEKENIKNSYEHEVESYQKKYEEINRKIDSSTKDYKNKISSIDGKFSQQMKGWEKKIKDLENSYDDLLRLDKPARYWQTIKKNYEKKGRSWIKWTIGVSSGFVVFLIAALWFFPEWMKGNIGLDQVKGIIIFTIIVSTFSYLIYTFVRLATSAYHLSRDADERRQLTYLYLSLLKEGGVEPSERQIILQSLFARADTGLIKGDGTPQMPLVNPLVSKVMENFQK
ncbi:MAG: hypothetical protein K9J16_05190 [Melioribacteraceae bacterium]|nr:hypothetical protein [Melioribacteraceae bacterium]MCF8354854.1 hypothetical protein [Melioribacteraceae bacterium]MCF8392961.1 hypothetical protein [Melioribacteraceae bacterium]MCF8417296.1 hypothetical protein [Melioribacteraceae bacterium]